MTFAIRSKVTLRLVIFDHDQGSEDPDDREQRGQESLSG